MTDRIVATETPAAERKGRSWHTSAPHSSVRPINATNGRRTLPLPELVTRAQSGDTGALDTLILRFQNMAVGLAASLLGGMPGAEDIAQEAFVEALRRLPDLQHPAAFPSLLQSLVRKHADRMTRRRQFRAVTLDDASGATVPAAFGDPAKEFAVSEMRDVVRQAVRDLPEAERAVVLLFYVGDQSLKEIAEMLGVPVSTVKGRLHAARTRLKRRMFTMSEDSLKEERPSTTEQFREKVKRGRLYEKVSTTYVPSADGTPPPPRDWELMERERDAFEEKLLAGEPLDWKTVRHVIGILFKDFDQNVTTVELLDIYLARPNLTPLERFGAQNLRLQALFAGGFRVDYLRQHREFMDWARSYVGTGAMSEFAPDEAIPLASFLLSIHCFDAWYSLGYFEEWLTRARQILAEMPPHAVTRRSRDTLLRTMATLLGREHRYEEAEEAVRAVGRLSDEEDRDWESPWYRINMLMTCDFRCMKQDGAFVERDNASRLEVFEQIERLVWEYIPTLDLHDEEQARRYYDCLDECAECLFQTTEYERAWGYYQRLIARGHSGFRELVHAAATLWKTQGEEARAEVVSLLHKASVHPSTRHQWTLEWFQKTSEFAEVRNDPEFVAAATAPSAR